ncbi:M1 family aminopeptidase [Paraglaciecola sp.]|uniref:ABC transporter permease/M1 family aminopeptidase n=1 Tax=Paraglaciecola sp. TaxID=1920173 RepID=UPI0030F44EAD
MLLAMLKFEWRYFVRQPSFIVTCLVFFLLPFLAMVVDQLQIGSGGNVLFNSSFAITQSLLLFGIFGMFMVVNFVANTATRNDLNLMSEIISTKPVKPFGYNFGRFIGAYLVCVAVFAMVPLGLFLGSIMPWLDVERLGTNSFGLYLAPFIVFSLTTIFVFATLFYAVAQQFKSIMAVYLTALGLFITYVIAGQVFDEPDQRSIRALLDPFALNTFGEYARYWTAFEKNSLLPAFEGYILQNRLLWLAIGSAILLLGGGLFRPLSLSAKKSKKVLKEETIDTALLTKNFQHRTLATDTWAQFTSRTRFEIKQVFFSPAFLVLLLFSSFQLIANFFQISGMFGTPNWPLTQTMVNLIGGSFSLMLIIVITYYSAEVVWRERTVGMGDIVDSMPVHNLTFWLSKLVAVFLVVIALYVLGTVCAIINQLVSGYYHIEISQYLISLLYFDALPFCLLVLLAFFLQAISPNKYVGMLLFVGYFFVSLAFSQLGIEHNMFNFAAGPRLQYSDLNGYGWFMQTQLWYMFYWLSLSVVLGVLSYGLWQRGPNTNLKQRLKLLSYQLGSKGWAVATVALLCFVGSGTWIHYNTKVLNDFYSQDETLDFRADYEKQFVELELAPFPTITAVDAKVDIFPHQRRIEASASIQVINRSDAAISRFLVNLPQYSRDVQVNITGGQLGEIDEKFNTAWFEFTQPLEPNEERSGQLVVVREHQGFKDKDEDPTLINNGTFIDNFALFPNFGFNGGIRMNDRHERRKRDLEPLQRAYLLEDTTHYNESFFGPGVEFINFSATISTSNDQFAIAPGYLQREWQENGRNYYRYEMDAPMVNFFSLMSAKLESKKEVYKGIDLEVYYHANHAWNIDRMIESAKDSIDYFQQAFGPYQHKQLRIIEFPGYRGFAQSFANTVPYSEDIGFITDLSNPDDIDPVYYVTAHEVAHQWWGHQLNAANVQGSAILSESLSQYSALMVMKNKYGETRLRKFLTYELDGYLRGRSSELLEEMPLMRSEDQQYIHYQKGSIVMMALEHELGEAALNQALSELLAEFKFRSDVYPTTLDLIRYLNSVATPEQQSTIQDMFAQITLYDLRAIAVESETMADGKIKVKLTVSATQFSADGKGQEIEQPFDQQVEIALFSADPNKFSADNEVIYQGVHALKSGETQLEIIVDKMPSYAGIDPFVRFIDRDTDNNIINM